MKLTVNEVSKLTGVTIRTLHYYDEIGLLAPSETSEAGYRYYDDEALEMLQQIMFYRELDFPLKDIKTIVTQKDFDRMKALHNHKELLYLKRNRLNELIGLVDEIIHEQSGEPKKDFSAFDMEEIERMKNEYRKEVIERWGETDEFRQSEEKSASKSKADWRSAQEEAEMIFDSFAQAMDKTPADPAVLALVAKWQEYICRNYYDCSDEMLEKLGEMYTADERFRDNLDSHGKGTAQFMSDAIKEYCSQKGKKS